MASPVVHNLFVFYLLLFLNYSLCCYLCFDVITWTWFYHLVLFLISSHCFDLVCWIFISSLCFWSSLGFDYDLIRLFWSYHSVLIPLVWLDQSILNLDFITSYSFWSHHSVSIPTWIWSHHLSSLINFLLRILISSFFSSHYFFFDLIT